ncbi:MAG: septum site-determining protein MinC [Clostridia bacterium]|nr:septum site-determining protein MinC [Clostridia bacterium]
MNNCVSIVLGKEEITLKINEKAKEEEIEKCLEEKIPELKKLYQDEKTPIFVTGKVLKTKEMEMVQTIIQKEIEVNIEFDSPKVLGLHGIKKAFVEEIESSETKFHRGSLRSGKKIEFEGSLVIMGDVNRGAEIIAGENIVVLGILRGMAHAGAKGNKKAFVVANEIDVAQIRIANVIKEMEITEEEEQTIKTYAYVKENEIILE